MKNLGFTLVELVISIMIIAIISAVAVPGILSYQSKQLEDQFVNQFINQLRTLENISLTKDIYTKFYIQNRTIYFCENESTNCKELAVPSNIDTPTPLTIDTYYFDKYANVLHADKLLLQPNEVVFETNLYKIKLNRYGGISKENKPQ